MGVKFLRKPVIGGNWKMYKTIPEGIKLAEEILENLKDFSEVDVFICPPFTLLEKIGQIIKKSPVKLGAQNMHWEEEGACTGEISSRMLLDAGCEYVLLGHSERRHGVFQESDEIINKKLKKALLSGLKPVLCVGETRDERKSGNTENIVRRHIVEGLKDVSFEDIVKVIIAYEPVWAIGTGDTATPEQAEEVHLYIRGLLAELYNQDISQKIRIQYGGSVKPDNMGDLISKDNIDGGLIGGASLKADSFARIIKACKC